MSDDAAEDDSQNVPIVPTLAELIGEKRDLRGYSYADLETRAGHTITRQRWQQLGSGARVKEFSEPDTIRAMAAALEVDESLVVLAMAKSIGLNVELGGAQSALARMLPASARDLTAEQRNAIVGMVRVIGQSQSQYLPNKGQGGPVPDPIGDQIISSIDPEVDDTDNGGEKAG